MKINVWLYDDKGHCKASRYFFADNIEVLLKILASIEKEGYSSYTIEDGSNSRARIPKHSEQIVLRCDSCGAAIRVGDKYNKLHVKGQKYCFCSFCVGLSEFTAKRGDI